AHTRNGFFGAFCFHATSPPSLSHTHTHTHTHKHTHTQTHMPPHFHHTHTHVHTAECEWRASPPSLPSRSCARPAGRPPSCGPGPPSPPPCRGAGGRGAAWWSAGPSASRSSPRT